MFAGGFASDHGIVGQRFVDLQRAESQARGNLRDQLIADIAEYILRIERHGHKGGTLHRITLDERLKCLFEDGRQLHQRSTSPRTMSMVPIQAIKSATRPPSESFGRA